MARRPIRRDEPVAVRLSAKERDLLLEHAYLLEPLLGVLASPEPAARSSVTVRLTPDDLDELLGHVAFRANHADEPTVERRFEALYDRLAAFEATLEVVD